MYVHRRCTFLNNSAYIETVHITIYTANKNNAIFYNNTYVQIKIFNLANFITLHVKTVLGTQKIKMMKMKEKSEININLM